MTAEGVPGPVRMRSLFWRIFLWFWLVTAVLVGLMVMLSPLWTRVRPAFSRWEQQAASHLGREVEEAAGVLRESGPEGLGARFGGRGHPGHPDLYLVDERGLDRWGRTLPPGVDEVVRLARASGETEVRRKGAHFVVGRRVAAPDGRSWVVVLERGPRGRGRRFGPPPRPVELLDPGALIPLAAALLMVVGILSWALARWVTSPVRALRTATRRIAGGDLSARVGTAVGRRRDEVGELARDFDSMAERLEEMVAAQRRLLRDVSHELRSPLARLSVALELARHDAGEASEEALDRGRRELDRLDELIGQLLTLTRLDGRDARAESRMVDVAALLREVADDAGFEAAARSVSVSLEGAEERLEVRGDEGLLRSALDNVVRNAVRHGPSRSAVEIRIERRSRSGQGLSIAVRDRGSGVPEEALEHLFEPFFRVEEARERPRGGAGLGLAIAARAVRLHGGSIAARNHPEGGLLVEIEIPAAPDPRR